MPLSLRDGATTLLTAAVVLIAVASILKWDVPLVHSWRLVALIIGVLGLMACIFSGTDIAALPGTYRTIMSILGGSVFLLVVLGLIFGSPIFAICAAVVTVTLWAIATTRHLLG